MLTVKKPNHEPTSMLTDKLNSGVGNLLRDSVHFFPQH